MIEKEIAGLKEESKRDQKVLKQRLQVVEEELEPLYIFIVFSTRWKESRLNGV